MVGRFGMLVRAHEARAEAVVSDASIRVYLIFALGIIKVNI